jgi:DNA modification methylase
VAIALQDDGWIVRSDIVWSKPNPMPESVKDRPTKSHEYVFLLTKSQQYFYDAEAVAEPARYDGRKDTRMKGSAKYKAHCVPGAKPQSLAQSPHERWRMNEQGERIRNARSVWEIATQPNGYAHFATMPQKLAERCILAGCPDGGVVLDPFMGSGTTALAARKLKRNYIGIELNPEYVALANRRLSEDYTVPLFA